MLTIKEPLKLTSFIKLPIQYDVFAKKLLADYAVINEGLAPQELIYLSMAPAELYVQEGGMTSLVFDNSSHISRETRLSMANHIINRILWNIHSGYTYRDSITISMFLRKLGIRDAYGFIRQTRSLIHQESHKKQMLHRYSGLKEKTGASPKTGTAGAAQSQPKSQEAGETETNNRLYLHQAIWKRLESRIIYHEVSRHARSEALYLKQTGYASFMTAQQSRLSDWLLLTELKQTTWKHNPVTTAHIHNAYEAVWPAGEKDAAPQITSQAAAAVFIHMIGMTFETYARSYMSGSPIWADIRQEAYQSAGDAIRRLEENYKDFKYHFYMEQDYMNVISDIYQEEARVWNEYRKLQNHQEWKFFYSGLHRRMEQVLKLSGRNHHIETADYHDSYEWQYQKLAEDIYHQELYMLGISGIDGNGLDLVNTPAKDGYEVETEVSSEPEKVAGKPKYQYLNTSKAYKEEVSRIASQELKLVFKSLQPQNGFWREKETDIKEYLTWLHKEYIRPKDESAVEYQQEPGELEDKLLYQIQELAKLESIIMQVYERQGPDYQINTAIMKSMSAKALVKGSVFHAKAYWQMFMEASEMHPTEVLTKYIKNEESLFETAFHNRGNWIQEELKLTLQYLEEQAAAGVNTGFSPPGSLFTENKGGGLEAGELSVKQEKIMAGRVDEPDGSVNNQPDNIYFEQLKQSLGQLNQKHIAIQEHLKETFMKETGTATPGVTLDIGKTRRQALLALKNPDMVFIAEDTLEEGRPKKQQRDKKVEFLLGQVDKPIRELYEKLLEYHENPAAATPGGFIHKGTPAQLMAGIEEVRRASLNLEYENQRQIDQELIHEVRKDQVFEKYLDKIPENAPVSSDGMEVNAIPLIHKIQETMSGEEIASYLAKRQSEIKTVEQVIQNTKTQDYLIRETKEKALEVNLQETNDIQEMIEQGIKSQIGSISETVLQKLEKRLQSDRYRRGY